jgi:hypothetical protein
MPPRTWAGDAYLHSFEPRETGDDDQPGRAADLDCFMPVVEHGLDLKTYLIGSDARELPEAVEGKLSLDESIDQQGRRGVDWERTKKGGRNLDSHRSPEPESLPTYSTPIGSRNSTTVLVCDEIRTPCRGACRDSSDRRGVRTRKC